MEQASIGKRLKELRGTDSQESIATTLGVSRASYSHYENDRVEPDIKLIQRMAKHFNVSTDYLLGRTDNKHSSWDSKLPELTAKDERDIAKDLEDMLKGLSSDNGYAAFDGISMDDMDEEDKELLIASLENSLRLAKRMAKQKFTPKKYRD